MCKFGNYKYMHHTPHIGLLNGQQRSPSKFENVDFLKKIMIFATS